MIEVEGLTRRFGDHVAVADISFTVGKNETVGFLGQNGAGKTTTMRMLAGFIYPNEGSVRIAGIDMLGDSVRARGKIGYLPEIPPLYLDKTVKSLLEYAALIRGVSKARVAERIAEIAPLCGIADQLDVPAGKLSKGFRQRVGIAQAVIHDPPVLILDEPMVGIDPVQAVEMRKLIRALGADHTILISTHILPDVSAVCDRVLILHQGKVVAEDRIENLAARATGNKRLRLAVEGPPDAITAALKGIQSLVAVDYSAPYHIVTLVDGMSANADILSVLVAQGWALKSMQPAEADLESIFLNFTGQEEKLP